MRSTLTRLLRHALPLFMLAVATVTTGGGFPH